MSTSTEIGVTDQLPPIINDNGIPNRVDRKTVFPRNSRIDARLTQNKQFARAHYAQACVHQVDFPEDKPMLFIKIDR